MPAALRARLDLALLSEQLTHLGRTRTRTELGETLIRIVQESLELERILVVLLDLESRRPTVFGGSFEERRRIGGALRRGGRAEGGLVDLAAILGPGVRVVPIRAGRDTRGLILLGSEERTVESGDREYVRFLADRAAEILPRHYLPAREEEGARGREGLGAATEPRRILCLDGEARILALLGGVFERDGHEITVVRGPETGLERLRTAQEHRRPYHLVLLDVGGERAPSREFVDELRRLAPGLPLLALATGRGPSESLRNDPAIRVLQRPVDPMEIRRAIRDLLGR